MLRKIEYGVRHFVACCLAFAGLGLSFVSSGLIAAAAWIGDVDLEAE